MKILNPQSAILPNAEVLHYLRAHPLRDPDRKLGSYTPTSQSGHATIRRDLLTYFSQVTPWAAILADKFQAESYLHPQDTSEVYDRDDGWMRVLLQRLAKYELTKGEVVMLLNLGLGLEDWEGRMPPRLRGGEDGVRNAEEQRVSDEWVLGAVCEELEQRFGPEEIQGILGTVGKMLREKEAENGNGSGGGPVGDGAQSVVSEWRSTQGRDGAGESGDVEMEEAQQHEQ